MSNVCSPLKKTLTRINVRDTIYLVKGGIKMKTMLKNKGIVSFMIFMISVSYFYSVSLKNNNNVEMISSEVITTQDVNIKNI